MDTPVTITPDNAPVIITPDAEVPTGKQFEAENKLSPYDRQANEFFLGMTSGASGLQETEHPVADTLKALAQPPSMREQAINAIVGPGAGIARGLYGIGKELLSPKQEGESDEDAEARRAHAVGTAVGQVLPLMLGEGVEKAPATTSKVKAALPENLGAALRDPVTNEIKPGVKIAVKVGGAAAGHTLGLPGLGELGGYLLGGEAADMLIPDHPTYVKNQLFETRAQELMRRGREQAALDRQAAREAKANAPKAAPSNPFPTATSTNPLETAAMPARSLPTTPAGSVSPLPEAAAVRTTPFPARFVSKFEAPESAPAEVSEPAQDLISRNTRVVQPGEMPSAADLKRAGDYTQIPALKLKALKKFGDRLAAIELTRRGIND